MGPQRNHFHAAGGLLIITSYYAIYTGIDGWGQSPPNDDADQAIVDLLNDSKYNELSDELALLTITYNESTNQSLLEITPLLPNAKNRPHIRECNECGYFYIDETCISHCCGKCQQAQ